MVSVVDDRDLSVASFGGAYRSRVCIRVFIEVSMHGHIFGIV